MFGGAASGQGDIDSSTAASYCEFMGYFFLLGRYKELSLQLRQSASRSKIDVSGSNGFFEPRLYIQNILRANAMIRY